MAELYSLNSILDAIENINSSSKKKIIKNNSNEVKKIENNQSLLPITEKLILEAENYSKLIKNKPLTPTITNNDILILDNEYVEQNVEMLSLEEVKKNVIDDLYSSLSKKVKKNTLKIIFDLHLKIKNLENRLENTKDNKKQELKINKNFSNLNNRDILKEDVVTSLKIQDSSIAILNKKIINFKKSEEKLLLQVIDLEQDKTILSKQAQKFKEFNNYKNVLHTTKKTLKSIYDQVMKQKKIFQELKNYSIKIERESKVYKENYEKLVIENNDIKLRLTISKEQNITYQKNKLDLLSSINHLNEILSKTNIVKNISSQETSSEKKILKLEKKFEINE